MEEYSMIYVADTDWLPTKPNPFSKNLTYGEGWSAFIYDPDIGLKQMLEPADYSDYIMLDIPNGCGELVVNSRQLGTVCTDPKVRYIPGIRLYFDVEKMFEHQIAVRDGLHLLKVKDKLPLKDYLIATISAKDFDTEIEWTPTLFTSMANELFFTRYKDGKES